jgi:hypothetical protein
MLCRLTSLTLVLFAIPIQASAAASSADPAPHKIVNCYNASAVGDKSVTIRQVYTCSGVWVTPRALMRCALEAECQALPDTVEGRATLDATLKSENLNRDSALVLRPGDLPPMPNAQKIADCKKTSKTEEEFKNCVLPTIPPNKYATLRSCFEKATEAERVECFAKQVSNPAFTGLLACVGGGRPSLRLSG